MKLTASIILLTAFLLAIVSCSTEAQFDPLIVDGAYDIQQSESQNTKRKQITFKVDIDYPGFAIKDINYKEFRQSGWSKCGGDLSGWDSYPDASNSTPHFVHQHIQHWSRGDSLMTIIMRYYSEADNDEISITSPRNSIQHVILLYDDYDDLSEVTARLGLSCEGNRSS